MSETIGMRIERLLTERDMSQRQLALRAGLTESSVTHYIHGGRMPRFDAIERMSKVLGVPAPYLAFGEGGKNE